MQLCPYPGIQSCMHKYKLKTRWKIDYGKAWQHLGGEIHGQTQMSYFLARGDEQLTFNHPIDVHFAEAGLQVLIRH